MLHAKVCRMTRLAVWRLVLCALPIVPVLAQVPPSGDTYVSSSFAKTNFGSGISLVVAPGTSSYVQFNLSGIPAGASISKASLRLFVDAIGAKGSFDVYELNSAWNESSLTYNTPPPGLGISATGGHPVAITASSQDQFLLIDITTLVQGWVNRTIPNNGVALALSGSSGAFSFDSKESLLTGNGPELEIVLNGGTGPQGSAGPAGPQGPQGSAGAVGPTGATGAQGLPGVAGPQGAAGTGFNFRAAFDSTASYAANDVVSYNGSSYVAKAATNPGDPAPDSNPNWSLMAQQGAPGLAGAPGAQGPLGPAGGNGSAGGQGPQGVTGPQGPPGLPGSGGFTGIMEVHASTDFTIPADVKSLLVEAWGGGGGGATGLPGGTTPTSFQSFSGSGGGGGGAGAYARGVVAVVPGTTCHLTIGSGGAAGTLANGTGVDGSATQITDPSANVLLSVAGGHGGSVGSLNSGGFGGGGGGAPSGVNVVGRPGGPGGSGSPQSTPCTDVRGSPGAPAGGSIPSGAGTGGLGGAGGCDVFAVGFGFPGTGGYMLITW